MCLQWMGEHQNWTMEQRKKGMENLDFSEEEIQEQLAALGYTNVPKQRLREFKRDLDLLIHHEKSKSSTSAGCNSPQSYSSSSKSPPAFTKEKVQVPNAASERSYIYTGNRATDQHRQVLTSTFNDENYDSINLGPGDSYIKYSVAPACMRPSTAPNRLQLESASSDVYHSAPKASEPMRPQRDLHLNTKPALKRKVLRKRRGHSQVCDESTHSEDSAYSSQLEHSYEEDNKSLSSSFWTDPESEDERGCYVKDDRIKTELGIYKQEMNKEEEWCVKDDSVCKQIGEKLQEGGDCRKDDKEQYKYEDSKGKLKPSQLDDRTVKTPQKECEEKRKRSKSRNEEEDSEDHIREVCSGEEVFLKLESLSAELVETGDEEARCPEEESDNDDDDEEEQSKYFCKDQNSNRSLDEESESDDLETEEEIEYSKFSQSVMKADEQEEKIQGGEEVRTVFMTQDDVSELVMNDKQMCTGGRTYKDEQYSESRFFIIAEKHSDSHDKNAVLGHVDSTDDTDRKNKGSAVFHADPDGNGAYAEEDHGSVSSLTASILTSGYGSYKPDSLKDDLDAGDDCSLFGLEVDTAYPSILYTQDDPSLTCYRDWLSLEVAEQQIPSVTLNRGDWTHFDSFTTSDGTMYNDSNSVQDTANGNGLRSTTVCPEDSQILTLSAESDDPPCIEEKITDNVNLQATRTSSKNVAFYNENLENLETFCMCNDSIFNTTHNECMTTIKDHRTKDGHVRQDFRKTKQLKFHRFRQPVSGLEERLGQLHVSAPRRQHELYSESEETSSYSDGHSSVTEELPSAFQVYLKGMARSCSENDIRPRPKSFIRPVMDHPHTRNLKKTDPVAKYFQYKQDWELFKPPGEKCRKELHWAIREQLAYQPPPPKPQRTYIPNTYMVPTAKKRSALRWEIRHDLANGIIPARVSDL